MDVVFVATYRKNGDDPEMAERVRRHQRERPSWRTFEAPERIGDALAELQVRPSGVIVDCLTLWLSDRLAKTDDEIVEAWGQELDTCDAASWPTLVVGNEVGWSLVPENPILRRFRDLSGILGQRTAERAAEAYLMVAGCALRLK